MLPPAGSRGDVVISFDRPMDQALALNYVINKGRLGTVAGRAGTLTTPSGSLRRTIRG